MLRVVGLGKSYGGLETVDDVTFDVENAVIRALVGNNGTLGNDPRQGLGTRSVQMSTRRVATARKIPADRARVAPPRSTAAGGESHRRRAGQSAFWIRCQWLRLLVVTPGKVQSATTAGSTVISAWTAASGMSAYCS